MYTIGLYGFQRYTISMLVVYNVSKLLTLIYSELYKGFKIKYSSILYSYIKGGMHILELCFHSLSVCSTIGRHGSIGGPITFNTIAV